MVIKVYISGISASQEVKKRQQRALLILDSVPVDYESVDITEPGREEERSWVQQTCKERPNPLPPQFFNDDLYCGDYEDFNSAVDIDKVLAFLKLDSGVEDIIVNEEIHVPAQNGKSGRENDEDILLTENEEERKDAEEIVEKAETEEIIEENDLVNEANGNNDGEDEALMEREDSDHAEEEVLEEKEEVEDDEDDED